MVVTCSHTWQQAVLVVMLILQQPKAATKATSCGDKPSLPESGPYTFHRSCVNQGSQAFKPRVGLLWQRSWVSTMIRFRQLMVINGFHTYDNKWCSSLRWYCFTAKRLEASQPAAKPSLPESRSLYLYRSCVNQGRLKFQVRIYYDKGMSVNHDKHLTAGILVTWLHITMRAVLVVTLILS